MAPLNFLHPRDFDLHGPAAAFREQWASPTNYAFTILLLLGGDVVARALAQLAGGRIVPVAFSFGTYCPPTDNFVYPFTYQKPYNK